MIKVTVELVPFGDYSQSEVISTMLIANIGGPVEGLCTYVGAYDVGTHRPAVKTTTHYRRDNVWSLIRNLLISRDYGTHEGDTYAECVAETLVGQFDN